MVPSPRSALPSSPLVSDDTPREGSSSEGPLSDEVTRLRAERRILEEERARLARELEAARADALQAEQRVESVLNTVSHELRTPLQALHICLELLHARIRGAADEVPQAWVLSHLEKAKGSSNRMTKLVRTLLDASRLQAGRIEVRPEPLDLSSLVADVVAAARDELAWARCPCTFSSHGKVLGTWDRPLLELVIHNLLSNAMKYGAGQPVHVEVEGLETSARITVKDHGVGISIEDQARIFHRFERVHTTTHLAGFGLGLWIVKQVATAMNGTVTVTSRPAEGATFVLSLPREPATGRSGFE
ncbi:HAMP domain-containing sensor histidine kinase [Polyangium sp. 15x6]|uniref:sensor histidine kinase n=1 Tax=Polyangium sp. 15x6 TaxID=3042687 RepID=UPI00249C4B7B|nr:HAMP domain-containing sensor histidine kinase [Polyangium sp. 15x6]MDI3282171.1 HAMP domain-containing sensor histidine kinase [Polyangium sp. 15x6]